MNTWKHLRSGMDGEGRSEDKEGKERGLADRRVELIASQTLSLLRSLCLQPHRRALFLEVARESERAYTCGRPRKDSQNSHKGEKRVHQEKDAKGVQKDGDRIK